MDIFSPWHLLIVLVIIVLIFGTGKLTKIGPDLGKAMRGFKSALHGGDEADKQKTADGNDKLQADPPAASSATHQEQRDSSESKQESP